MAELPEQLIIGVINNMKKFFLLITLLICFSLFFTACGNKDVAYNDGEYSGQSEPDDMGAYALVDLSIKEGKIVGVSFVTKQKDGTIKDSEYGKTNGVIENQSFYDNAQLAVAAMTTYAEKLAESGKIEDVDAISGATISHNQFEEAVYAALDKAK